MHTRTQASPSRALTQPPQAFASLAFECSEADHSLDLPLAAPFTRRILCRLSALIVHPDARPKIFLQLQSKMRDLVSRSSGPVIDLSTSTEYEVSASSFHGTPLSFRTSDVRTRKSSCLVLLSICGNANSWQIFIVYTRLQMRLNLAQQQYH